MLHFGTGCSIGLDGGLGATKASAGTTLGFGTGWGSLGSGGLGIGTSWGSLAEDRGELEVATVEGRVKGTRCGETARCFGEGGGVDIEKHLALDVV